MARLKSCPFKAVYSDALDSEALRPPDAQKMGGKGFALAAARPWVVLKSVQCCA
jgi:hypothetical protein